MLSLSSFGACLGEILPLVFTVPHLTAPKRVKKKKAKATMQAALNRPKRKGNAPSQPIYFVDVHTYMNAHTLSLSLNYGLQFPKTDIGFKLTSLLIPFFPFWFFFGFFFFFWQLYSSIF